MYICIYIYVWLPECSKHWIKIFFFTFKNKNKKISCCCLCRATKIDFFPGLRGFRWRDLWFCKIFVTSWEIFSYSFNPGVLPILQLWSSDHIIYREAISLKQSQHKNIYMEYICAHKTRLAFFPIDTLIQNAAL